MEHFILREVEKLKNQIIIEHNYASRPIVCLTHVMLG